MKETCKICRFWKAQPEYPTSGQCHRLPPVPAFQVAFDGSGMAQFETLWPNTASDEWCGEWQEIAALGSKLTRGDIAAKMSQYNVKTGET